LLEPGSIKLFSYWQLTEAFKKGNSTMGPVGCEAFHITNNWRHQES